MFLETHKKSELEATEKEYRDKTLSLPDNAFVRQAWVYHASLSRDAAYARAGRVRIKSNALNSLYMENYGGAKIAADSQHINK